MMHSKIWLRLVGGIALSSCLLAGPGHAAPWEEKYPAAEGLVDAQGQLLGADGSVQTDRGGNPLVPDCAFGVLSPTGPFRFMVQQGDPNRLLIVHDGGGACWENNTCGSALLNPALSAFDPLITETPDALVLAGGVLSEDNVANPFKGWTKVFIPYCTGDIGWGNRVTTYHFPDATPFQIHHRGYANIRTALRWVERAYQGHSAPAKVVLAGLSAGGYAAPGVLLPEARKLFPHASTKTYLISDSANGIVTDDFLSVSKQSWGYDLTLPNYVVSTLNRGAQFLAPRFYLTLGTRFPSTRFGQYQNAFDLVESQFYNTMLHVNDPLKWYDPQYLVPAIQGWSIRAQVAVLLTSILPNYRFYTAAGIEHTVILNTPAEAGQPFCSDEFYSEASAKRLAFRDWVNDMVNSATVSPSGSWRNASCFPNCVAVPKPGCPQ